jgi:hypothetical protein
MARISVQSAKAKGRKAQQLVRDAILAKYPELEPDDCKSIGMGQAGNDIELSPAARKVFPFAVEVKARAKVSLIYDAIAQAGKSDKNNLTPIAVVKADRQKALVVIDLDDFMDILGRLRDK